MRREHHFWLVKIKIKLKYQLLSIPCMNRSLLASILWMKDAKGGGGGGGGVGKTTKMNVAWK